jgi:hypothetical protein
MLRIPLPASEYIANKMLYYSTLIDMTPFNFVSTDFPRLLRLHINLVWPDGLHDTPPSANGYRLKYIRIVNQAQAPDLDQLLLDTFVSHSFQTRIVSKNEKSS